MIFAGLEQRRDEILRRIPALADAIKDGRKLGCWCAPQACHGEVLVELCERHLGRKIGSNNRKEHG